MNKSDKTYGIINNTLNQKLINKIESEGNFVHKFPNLLTRELKAKTSDDEIIENLQNFEWIIFTDLFAVEFFIKKLEGQNIDLFELDNLRVCAYGEAVADRLRFVQIHADVIADKLDDKKIFEQLKDYLLDLDEFNNLQILLIKEKNREFQIVDLLKNENALIKQFEIYQGEIKENTSKLKALTRGGAIDEFIFTSSDQVFDLSHFYYPETLYSALNEIDISAVDDMTIRSFEEFGLKAKLTKITK